MACLDEDMVLGFVDGTLDPDVRVIAERHLAGCASCADLVATTAGADPARLSFDRSAGEGAAADPGVARGATVGRYVILNLVGRGGMGEVYAAYDPQLDRRVALKLLHHQAGDGASSRTARERLLREAKTIARLSHPNVVVVHDAGEIDGRVFIAMEFIEGHTLGAWQAAAPRGWREIRDVFLAAGEGLAAAHEAGFVHRDFKPQNVMVGRDGAVRVMDFGLASGAAAPLDSDGDTAIEGELAAAAAGTLHQTVVLTRTGMLLGTPLYMAPEQFKARPADARSDQFSFCIALYESLYGERPFPSDSFAALAQAVLAGRVREPAQKTRAPAFIRKLLLRGLRPEAADRHPSMRPLLGALAHDPARWRRSAIATGAIVLLALAGATASERFATRGQRSCRGAGDKLAAIWPLAAAGAGADRREGVHRAFLATGASYAAETWTRVAGFLDDYARRWSDAYVDACEATHARGDQSAEVLDLRMSCLEQPRGALRALTDVLGRADKNVLVQAVSAAQALPSLDRCADVPQLRAVVPPPADAPTRARVAAVHVTLADVKALTDTGQWAEARQKAGSVAETARAIGYGPLLGEALLAQAVVLQSIGDAAAGAKSAEEAMWTALASRRDDVAFECAALLSGINGYTLGRYEDAERWDHLGQALLDRLGPGHERAAAWLIQDRGLTRARKGELQAAVADIRASLALKQKVLAPENIDIGKSWSALGAALTDLGDVPGALDAYDHQLDNYRRASGADSPTLAHPLGNRGEVLALLGRHAEAQKDLRDSIRLWTAVVEPDHPWIAYPLTALGKSLLAVGQRGEAVATLERAVRIREHGEPKPEVVAESRFALARARWEAGQERDAARALAVAARDAYRAQSGQGKHVAEIDAWLASHARPGGVSVAAH